MRLFKTDLSGFFTAFVQFSLMWRLDCRYWRFSRDNALKMQNMPRQCAVVLWYLTCLSTFLNEFKAGTHYLDVSLTSCFILPMPIGLSDNAHLMLHESCKMCSSLTARRTCNVHVLEEILAASSALPNRGQAVINFIHLEVPTWVSLCTNNIFVLCPKYLFIGRSLLDFVVKSPWFVIAEFWNLQKHWQVLWCSLKYLFYLVHKYQIKRRP